MMYIRKAKRTDANDLKVLYFRYLTQYPPKEEQDMSLWQYLLDKFEKDERRKSCFFRTNGDY